MVLVAASGRPLAKIEEGGLAVLETDRHKAAAADIAGGRIEHCKRIADGNGSIDGVAALLQDLDADCPTPDAGR